MTVLTMETDKAYAPTFVFNCLTATVAGIVDMKLVQSKEVNGDNGVMPGSRPATPARPAQAARMARQ